MIFEHQMVRTKAWVRWSGLWAGSHQPGVDSCELYNILPKQTCVQGATWWPPGRPRVSSRLAIQNKIFPRIFWFSFYFYFFIQILQVIGHFQNSIAPPYVSDLSVVCGSRIVSTRPIRSLRLQVFLNTFNF